MPKPSYFQGMGILTPLLMVKFLWGVRLSFEMVVILTISQKSPGILAKMITIDTVDGKTIYGLCALSDHRSPEQRKHRCCRCW